MSFVKCKKKNSVKKMMRKKQHDEIVTTKYV